MRLTYWGYAQAPLYFWQDVEDNVQPDSGFASTGMIVRMNSACEDKTDSERSLACLQSSFVYELLLIAIGKHDLGNSQQSHATAGASQGWFHLYQMMDNATVPAEEDGTDAMQLLSSSAEDFVQTSTLGEFKARLGLINSFRY